MKKKPFIHHIRYMIISAIFSLFLSDSYATIYYVSPNGDDSRTATQSQNISTPWKTIQKAADNVAAGDTVYVRAGIYFETVDMKTSGQDGKPIIFKEYPGEIAIVDGSQSSDPRVVYYGAGNSYIVWDGIDVRNGNQRGFWIEGNYHVVMNCKVYGNGAHNGSRGVGYTGLQAVRVNYIRVMKVEAFNNGWNGMAFEDSQYATIEHNYCHHNIYHNGIDLKSPPYGTQSMQTGNNIRFNVSVYNKNHGIYLRYQERNEISNNVLCKNNDAGIFFHYEAETSGSKSVYDGFTKVYNNTIADNGWCGIANESANYLTIRNNIVYNNGTDMSIQKTGHTIDHNLQTNPGFKNASDTDYALADSSSPAIDAGINLTSEGITTDIIGTARPVGNGFDIGAYEYQATAVIKFANKNQISASADFVISPNPFNPITSITFSLSEVNQVKISIFNLNGGCVRSLVNEKLNSGMYTTTWDGKASNGQTVSSGVYVVSMETGKTVQNKMISFIR